MFYRLMKRLWLVSWLGVREEGKREAVSPGKMYFGSEYWSWQL